MKHEEWRWVAGYEGRYEVSSFGRVRSVERITTHGRRRVGKFLKPNQSAKYHSVCLGLGNSKPIHVLVLKTFVGPRPEKNHARHLDGDSSNNRADNLAWGTPSENAEDRRRHGTMLFGELTGQSRLIPGSVQRIRDMLRSGCRKPLIAEWFDVNLYTIYDIAKGQTWRHLANEILFKQ